MKKTIVLAVFATLLAGTAAAQDTVRYLDPRFMFTERIIDFEYYPLTINGLRWENCMGLANHTFSYRFNYSVHSRTGLAAPFHTTDTARLVYGVALTLSDYTDGLDIIYGKRDSTSTRPMEILARKHMDSTNTIVNRFEFFIYTSDSLYNLDSCGEITELYEVYFDEPIPVADSFYVGEVQTKLTNTLVWAMIEEHSYVEYTYVRNPLDTVFYEILGFEGISYCRIPHWSGMFPIVAPPCFPVRNIGYDEAEGGLFRLWWDNVGDSVQVQVVSDTVNHTPVLDTYTTDTTALLDLDPENVYYVRLRRRCPYGNDKWSQWSEYRLLVPDTTGGHGGDPHEGILQAGTLTLALSPNPAHGTVTLSADIDGEALLRVVDMAGREVMHRTVSPADLPLSLDIGRLPRGSYTVSLATAAATATRPLAVQ